MTKDELIAEKLREAAKRADWYQTGEAKLLYAAADALEAATRERDAALAAIERIRQAVSGHPECDRYEEGDVISCGWKSAYASVVAALDGAPEPEWEYGAKIHNSGKVQRISDTAAGVRLGYSKTWHIDAEWVADTLVRRRKAGPWIEVQGEQ